MKAVIVGATGHLGAYVSHHLSSRGVDVVAVSRGGSPPAAPFGRERVERHVRTLAVDVRSNDCVAPLAHELGDDVTLIHLAGVIPATTATSTADERRSLFDVNVLGTLRILDAARRARHGVRAIVYASTFEVYGVPETPAPVVESSPTRPVNDYGATKLSGEDHLFAFAEEERVRTVALRLPAIYGPGESALRALPNFLRAIERGERPRVQGDGKDRRDQIHVLDAARSIERAMFATASGAFNVSDGVGHSIAALARTAMAVGGISGEPEFVRATRRSFDFHMSIERARTLLGYEPAVLLADGMRDELAWMRMQRSGAA